MDAVVVIEIFTALVAVIGLICFVKFLSDTFFLPREILTVITITDDRARENADILIHVLKKGMWRWGNRRIYIILSKRYSDDDELLELIASAGLEYYIINDQ